MTYGARSTPSVPATRAQHDLIAVLEVGGTHVTSACVAPRSWTTVGAAHRQSINCHAAAEELLESLVAAGTALEVPSGTRWAIAIPDPFDYQNGVGNFHGVAKFAALDGVDLRTPLAARLGSAASQLTFCNDADAFTLGEFAAGTARQRNRVVGLTLGTGVGSGWVVDGRVVDPGLPPGGRAHLLEINGRPLEDAMSRRAIRAGYRARTGDDAADVRDICERARRGEVAADQVLAAASRALGSALAPALVTFDADVLVVGGSMSRSWDLLEPCFREGAAITLPPIAIAPDAERAALIGAAWHAASRL